MSEIDTTQTPPTEWTHEPPTEWDRDDDTTCEFDYGWGDCSPVTRVVQRDDGDCTCKERLCARCAEFYLGRFTCASCGA